MFDVEVLGTRITHERKPAIQGMMIDISARKRAEQKLQASLREKEVLLRLKSAPTVRAYNPRPQSPAA